MLKPAIPENEDSRLRALRQLSILDTEPEAAFDDITMLASSICGTPLSMVSLVDADRQWFKSKVGTDTRETPRDVSFCGHGILQSDLFTVPDAAEDERFRDNPLVTGDPRVRFYAGAPLTTSDGASVGMLCVLDRVPRTLEPWQQQSLAVLARQVVAQMELRHRNRQLESAVSRLEDAQAALRDVNRQLHELATRDGLTGLLNHRAFQESLRLEYNRAVRYADDLSILMIDVDHFKRYNDTFGHPAGDAVLKRLAGILSGNVRDTDLAARYGGEEFAIILPNTPPQGARDLGERLRAAVAAEPWQGLPITISVGSATLSGNTASAPDLLADADAALYHSKSSGRNAATHLHDVR